MSSSISVGYNVNTSQYFAAMDAMADKSEQSMDRAGQAADRWQSRMDASAGRVGDAAGQVASNFEAANDAVARSAERSASALEQINQAAEKVDLQSWSSKVSTEMGRAYGEGTAQAKSAAQDLVDWVQSKLIITGVAIAAGVTVGALTAVYTAYKVVAGAMDFVAGLFTGDSYKSDNIDTLIAANREVMKLQDALGVAAAKASAFNEALKNLGVDQDAYLGTTQKGNKAIRDNTDELDRLGVKYKDAAGNLRPLIDVQRSAVEVLQRYKAGWDRHEAAAAIGMGSEKELQDAISVTEERVGAALDRLIAYNLVIGDGTQAAVSNYERAMRQFQRETDLTSQGFKRAIADNIMPTLADMADFFQEGFPNAVRGFRVAIASVTFLMLGLKTTAYTVSEGVLESFMVMGDVVARVGTALQQAMSGHFDMAVKTIMNAPDDLGMRWNAFMMNVRAQMTHNREAFELAWGGDSRNAKAQIVQHEAANSKLQPWVPPTRPNPAAANSKDIDASRQMLAGQLQSWERTIEAERGLLSQRNTVLERYYRDDLLSIGDYYEARASAQRENMDRVSDAYAHEEKILKDFLAHTSDARLQAEAQNRLADVRDKSSRAAQEGGAKLEQNAFEQARAYEQLNRQLEALDARYASMMGHAEAAAAISFDSQNRALATKLNAEGAADALEKLAALRDRALEDASTSSEAGARRAFRNYIQDAQNTGRAVESALSRSFSSMEDALVSFTTTGIRSFKSFADSVVADLMRIAVRQQITAPMAAWLQGQAAPGGGLSGFLGNALGSLSGGRGTPNPAAVAAKSAEDYIDAGGMGQGGGMLSQFMAMLPSFDVGTEHVPHDMVAKIHAGEKIVPAAQNKPGYGGVTQHLTIQVSGQMDSRTTQQIALQAGIAVQRALARGA